MELKKVKNQIKNKRYSIIIYMGIFLFFLGSTYLIYNHYDKIKKSNQDQEMVEEFFEEESEEVVEEQPQQEEQPIQEEVVVNYMAVLEIPKINLKRGLFDKNSYNNKVNRNIYMLKETTLPDKQTNSHIILAAHSGNSYISYFRNLTKLDMKDKVNFYYKGIKYIYEVSNRYEIEKTGTTELIQTNTSDITLISCISGTNRQVVYVATLINQENY